MNALDDGSVSALANQQAFGLVGQQRRDHGQNHADQQRCPGIERRLVEDLAQKNPEERDE